MCKAASQIEQLADEVSRGRISRNQVAKQHGKDVAAAVRAELARRDELARASFVHDSEPESDAIETYSFCEDCEAIIGLHESRCERCEKRHTAMQWIDETAATVESLAIKNGWSVDSTNRASETMSRYISLSRENDVLTVRVSDHGSCYCSEDISLAMSPGGDDHSIETLIARLTK